MKRLKSSRSRENLVQKRKKAKTVCNWRTSEWMISERIRIDFERICRISELFSQVDTRDRKMKELFLEFRQMYNKIIVGFSRFKNEAKLLGYQYCVSKREFRKSSIHPDVSFKTFESILKVLEQFPRSVLFFDVSTFMFETNPRKAWQSKEKPTRFYSSTNYKRYHILLAA